MVGWRCKGHVKDDEGVGDAAREGAGERMHLETVFSFAYFWLRWVFVAARGSSLGVASWGYSLVGCAVFSPCRAPAPGCKVFSRCSTWAQERQLAGSRA